LEKALELSKTSATGSFQIFIGVALSTIIMAIGSIILGRLLGTDGYGLYGIVIIPVTTMNLFRDWGINSAITRYVASLRETNRDEEIHNVIVAGFIFEVASGLALSFLSLALATFIASAVFHRPESAVLIEIMSVSIISGSLLAASQGVFVGYERMELNSFTLICQAIVKTVIGPVLIFLGYGVLGAIIGYSVGFIAAAIIGLATFYFILFRPLRKKVTGNSSIIKTLREMLRYGVPLQIATILGGILMQYYSFIVVPLTSNTLYGNYLTAVNFTTLLTFITIPIATVLFPAFARLDPKKEHELVKTVYAASIKYTSILLIPATMALMALSGPMISTLYGAKYVYGPFFLTINVIGSLFAVFGSLSAVGLLSGLGDTRILMMQSIITLAIGLPLGAILIPMFGITGLIVTVVIDGLPSMFWSLYWIWKHYKAKADFQSSAKILVASSIAAVVAYLPTAYLNTANWIKLIIGLILFLTIYIFGAPLIGAISQPDITAIRSMFSSMGILSKIINLPLALAEKAARIRSRNKTGEKS
jgi:stage V sporulation protein B